MRADRKGSERAAPRSPLYTSRATELAKRQFMSEVGPRDLDGAFRAHRRLDKLVTGEPS